MAAIDFPNSPTPDQIFTSGSISWKWNSTLGVWQTYTTPVVIPQATATILGTVYGTTINNSKQNTAVGYLSLNANTTGQYNTAFGNGAMSLNTTGGPNTAFGGYALSANTTASYNTAFGFLSLGNNSTGSSNSAFGNYSLSSNTTGANNVGVGYVSLNFNTTGNNNVAIGYQSLYNNIVGSGNTAIGYQAGLNETGSNKLYIANSSTSTPLIYGDFSTSVVTINGSLSAQVSLPTNANSAKNIGYVGIPQVSTSTSLPIIADHSGKHIYTTVTGLTHTIPSNSTVPFEIGTTIVFINPAGVSTFIAISTDTMYLAGTGTTGTRTLAAYGMATVIKVSSNTWIISGNGLS